MTEPEEPENPALLDSTADSALRDLFAGFSIAGILGNPSIELSTHDAAALAGETADAMLKERAK